MLKSFALKSGLIREATEMLPEPTRLSSGLDDRAGLEVVVLGSAQDGGVPQLGCSCANCVAARSTGGRRLAASLAVFEERPGLGRAVVLVDAGPDLRRQWDLLPTGKTVLTGILLTHLHMGHVAGLLELGPEVLAAKGVPVYCTPAVARFLQANGPWSLLVEQGHVGLQVFEPGDVFNPLPGLAVRGFGVPHRSEFGDTVGYLLASQETGRSLLYIPDADRWEGMRPSLGDLVAGADDALLDGTFYDPAELVGRRGPDAGRVPHPAIRHTLTLLGSMAGRVAFTHLNHTNPVLDRLSPEAEELRRAGARLAVEGMRFAL